MGSDLGCCANLIRIVLIILNILFGALGVVVFAVGIWAVVEDQNYSFVTGDTIIGGAGILIFAGIVTMIICVVGILGAIFKLRPLLVMYAVAVAIIVVLEIVAGIVAFVFRDSFLEEFEERSLEAISLYRVDEDSDPTYREDVNDFVSFIQDTFDCCGFNDANDWIIQNPNAVLSNGGDPPECPTCVIGEDEDCDVFTNTSLGITFTTTTLGCGNFSSDRLTVFAYAVGGVGIAFGILEILGILFALFLCCCITSARKQEVV